MCPFASPRRSGPRMAPAPGLRTPDNIGARRAWPSRALARPLQRARPMSASNPVPPASMTVTLKYSVEGLSAHDALLLKSLVRLLS